MQAASARVSPLEVPETIRVHDSLQLFLDDGVFGALKERLGCFLLDFNDLLEHRRHFLLNDLALILGCELVDIVDDLLPDWVHLKVHSANKLVVTDRLE